MNIFEGSRRIAKVVAAVMAGSYLISSLLYGFELRDAKFVLGALAFIWVFTWVVGWIVRGFMGIPRGQDSKPPAADGSR
jgi:hypothetical protein